MELSQHWECEGVWVGRSMVSPRLAGANGVLPLQVQRQPAGGVAQGQRPDDVRRQGDPGASDPGGAAAAGEEEDGRGRRGHLLHVPGPHHRAGASPHGAARSRSVAPPQVLPEVSE